MVDIPYSAVDRIIRKGGAERVSKSAIQVLQKELEDYGITIARIGTEIAAHVGKKTIDGDIISLAIRKRKLGSG
jgi:histone H3/H4